MSCRPHWQLHRCLFQGYGQFSAVHSLAPLQFGSIRLTNHVSAREQKAVWKPKSYGTVSGSTAVGLNSAPFDQITVLDNGTRTESAETPDAVAKLFSGKLLEGFTTDRSTYSLAQVRATFYPKFENEKSDQEVRTRMIEMVSKGLATMEVSLKHSGSLFMYAGHEGGAYAKNSYGNILGFTSQQKQAEFNEFHKRSHGVTAVASFAPHLNQNVPVAVGSLLFSDKLAALEADPGAVDGEKISSKNEWPHVTLWTAQGVAAKEANALPQLLAQGKTTRVEINPPTMITGALEFF